MVVNLSETETKYDAPAGGALPGLEQLPQVAAVREPEEQRLEAEYYDTDDLRLIRAGITLRRRSGGGDAGWHLKLPAGADTRREIRRPLSSTARPVPGELAGLVRAHTRDAPLRPVARMTTTRRRRILLDQAGESLAEVAADDVSAQTLGTTTALSRWQEVEVELTGGDRSLLGAADKLLRRDGLRPAGRAAKLERALSGWLPKLPHRPAPTASSSAGEVVLAYFRANTETLMALDPMVRLDEDDAVHQMRVAARRLRCTLRSFQDVLAPAGTRGLAADLHWLGGMLGAARDGEVLAGHLEAGLRRAPVELRLGPVQARIQGHFASVRAAARTELLAALESERYFSLLDDLDALLDSPPFTARAAQPAASVLPAAARRARRKMDRRMRRAWRAAPGPARNEALRRARKSARLARYASEAMVPAIGGKARRFARQMKRIQSVLGEHQDSVITREVTRDLGIAAHLAGENAFSYGLLYEQDACDAERFQAQARQIWDKASGRPGWPG
jgi:CHAD domain-containing protein